jgi:small acid-soluble spore protein H (minor)
MNAYKNNQQEENSMNVERAKAIYDSPDTIAVQLDGKPIWIEHVDEANSMATVQIGSRPGNTQTVRVDRLKEQ